MKISVLLPIYNEEEGIKKTIPLVIKKLSKLFSSVELLAVDDGSTDSTSKILKDLQKKDKRIKIISHKGNIGYGAALRSGVAKATSEWIFFTDADMQFDPSEIKAFIPFMKDNDFIIGFRKKRADAWRRIIVSHGYNKVIKMLFGLTLKDIDCAFKLMRKSAVLKTKTASNSFFISAELMTKAHKKKMRIKELGVSHFPRLKGTSTVTPAQISRSMRDLLRLYRQLI